MHMWHDVGSQDDLTEERPLQARIGDAHIGVFLIGNAYYAIEDVCPHAFALLSDGFVEGDEVECALHGARFHLPTGKCTREPGDRDLRSYPVKLEAGRILVQLQGPGDG